jgi:hypothetical protein
MIGLGAHARFRDAGVRACEKMWGSDSSLQAAFQAAFSPSPFFP